MNTTTENATIAHQYLNAAVKAAATGMPRSAYPKPALRNVYATVSDAGGVRLHATDLETEVCISLGDCGGDAAAACLIPATLAAGIGKARDPVAIVSHGDTVEALGARIPAEDPMEFPAASEPMAGPSLALVDFGFMRIVDDHVSDATDDETSRFALGGVLLERDGAIIRAIGTDGRRIHVASHQTHGESDAPEVSPIVPPRAIRLFRKAVETMAAALAGKGGRSAVAMADGGLVRILQSGETIALSWAIGDTSVRVTSRTIQGRFPKWRDCFGAAVFEPAPYVVPMPEGAAQVKAAARVTSEQSKGVRIGGGCISAQSAVGGSFDAAFVGATAGVDATTTLDPRFLVAALEGAASVYEGAASMHVSDYRHGPVAFTSPFAHGHGLAPRNREIGFAAIVMPLSAD